LKLTDRMGEELVSFARRFQGEDIPTIIAGGYGLVLKARWVREWEARTMFPDVPGPRSTVDIDLFLTLEVISDAERAQFIRDCLEEQDYSPVKGAENYQFERKLSGGRYLKIDLLTPEPSGEEDVTVKSQRVRPRGASGTIHGRKVPEALTLEAHKQPIQVTAESGGKVTVYLPDPFTYYLLKLFALRDRMDEPLLARHHAFDIYLNLGMMTEAEWDRTESMAERYASEEIIQEATGLTGDLFGELEASGMLRLREYVRDQAGLTLSCERLNRMSELLLKMMT